MAIEFSGLLDIGNCLSFLTEAHQSVIDSCIDFDIEIFKKLEKESVVCLMTALFLKNRFQWQTTDQYKAQRRALSPFNITKERDGVLRKAAVKTTGVESLCSATTRISWVLWVVVSLVNFKTERETENLCFRHILYVFLDIRVLQIC